jgi:hypothetical protein
MTGSNLKFSFELELVHMVLSTKVVCQAVKSYNNQPKCHAPNFPLHWGFSLLAWIWFHCLLFDLPHQSDLAYSLVAMCVQWIWFVSMGTGERSRVCLAPCCCWHVCYKYKDLCNIVLHSAIIIVRQLNDLQNILIILLEPREKLFVCNERWFVILVQRMLEYHGIWFELTP